MRRRPLRTVLLVLVAGALSAPVGSLAAVGKVGGRTARGTSPASTALPVVTGTPKQNQMLSATSGTWSGTTPITYAYQWSRCGTTNLVENGAFETTVAGWDGVNGGAPSQSTVQAHGGTGSLKIVESGSTNGQGAQYAVAAPQIVAGRSYRFVAWVSATTSATVNATIRFYDPTGVELPGGGLPYVTVPGWNRLSVRLTAPAGAVRAAVQITVDRIATTLYADDVSLTGCATIPGATSPSYTVQAADAGSTLAAVVTATNSAGGASAMSEVTAMALDQFDTAPAYTGPVYSSNNDAYSNDPVAPPPIQTTLPTWRNLYDWPNGHGYAGWHYATSAVDSRYGSDTNHGGQPGLWLWPTGGQQYTPNYAEWTYTAPGTTRLSTVNLTFAYRNKFLAHHCLVVGLRTLDGTTIQEDRWCKPALPPDSQRDVQVRLADPKNDPTAKVLYFRVEFPACADPSSPSCSKYVPQLDPLTTGAYARLKLADMILVDDDNPLIQPSGPLWDIKDHFIDGTQAYGVTLGSTEPGSGIVSSAFSHTSTYPPATDSLGSQNAPCDPLHTTAPLDNRICPDVFSWQTSVPTPPYPEGPNAFTEIATDNAGNVGSLSWTMFIDRTSPENVVAAGDFANLGYIDGTQSYGLTISGHDPGRDHQRASGIARVWLGNASGGEVGSANASCDGYVCPEDFTGSLSVDTSQFPEGLNRFAPMAADLVGHSATGQALEVYVDRTPPSPAGNFVVSNYDNAAQTATVSWDQGDDPNLSDGSSGSGVAQSSVRFRVNAGAWGDWSDLTDNAVDASGVAPGATIDVEVTEVDLVGNLSAAAAGSVTVTGAESDPALAPLTDTEQVESSDVPADPPDDTTEPLTLVRRTYGHAVAASETVLINPLSGTSGSGWNFSNADGTWTIYRTCYDSGPLMDGARQYRRAVGPGYIAVVRRRNPSGSGTTMVNDLARMYEDTMPGYHDPGAVHGYMGAVWGGLGEFGMHYTRGTTGQLPGGWDPSWTSGFVPSDSVLLHMQVGALDHFPAGFPSDKAQLVGSQDARKYGMLEERMCPSKNGGYGVKAVQSHTWRSSDGSAWLKIAVTLGDPDQSVVTVTRIYNFTSTNVRVWAKVTELATPNAHGTPFVKEPKFGVALRGAANFKREVWFSPKDGSSTLGAQPNAIQTTGQIEFPQANLKTMEAGGGTHERVEWDYGTANCATCMNAVMRAYPLNRKGDLTAGLMSQLWRNTPGQKIPAEGLDAWALASAARNSSYDRETWSDGVLSQCTSEVAISAIPDLNGNGIYADDPSNPDLADIALFSETVNPGTGNSRQWELSGGWTAGDPASGTNVPIDPVPYYTASGALFHGWEGNRGRGDCEQKEVAFGPKGESYATFESYSIGAGWTRK
jgi:hypothetical protein